MTHLDLYRIVFYNLFIDKINFRLPKDKKEYELYNKIAEEFYKNGQIKANSIGTFARFCMRVVSG
jgi:hypothetical protein